MVTRTNNADNPNGIADDLAKRLTLLHRDLEDRGDKGADWSVTRALEDRIGAYQPTAGDFDRAEQMLNKYGF
jgi:hypothetical protein